MDVHIHSRSSYLTYSIAGLISEFDIKQVERTINLVVIDFSHEQNYLSLIEFVSEHNEWLKRPETKLIIIGDPVVYGRRKIKGIMYICLSAPLAEWRERLGTLLKAPAVDLTQLINMTGTLHYEKLTPSERDVISCIKGNMCINHIIDRQGISTKAYYARIYSIKRKLCLHSAREVYLNVDKIYNKIMGLTFDSEDVTPQ